MKLNEQALINIGKQEMIKLAPEIINEAKTSMPTTGKSRKGGPPAVRTGNLQRSINSRNTPKGILVYSNASYANTLEKGDYPFLTPAVRKVMKKYTYGPGI